ncbi:hypothetical protein GCM10011574_59100 [Microbispora bryophytorum]|uniref:Uncharacterized protein n=1 Tax=Microbispora bryophytorum TaxID=1460882 RepID=A0A8H9LDS6_9ACTN|nr:hypothetical protein GCM10011574_59100 [Microbispora bryophytorum]
MKQPGRAKQGSGGEGAWREGYPAGDTERARKEHRRRSHPYDRCHIPGRTPEATGDPNAFAVDGWYLRGKWLV